MGLYRDNANENGNYNLGFRVWGLIRVCKVFWSFPLAVTTPTRNSRSYNFKDRRNDPTEIMLRACSLLRAYWMVCLRMLVMNYF